MDNPTKEQILAASSGWIATTLNFFPGLGTGYIYQRRWLPYFITVGVATGWFFLGAVLNGDSETTKTQQFIGIGGLFLISIITMIEAKITYNNVVYIKNEQLNAKSQKSKSGLFR
tara:strand:- start:573 stop:917 length:345 start_codon:yes stop_codon:yes gene_type:complete